MWDPTKNMLQMYLYGLVTTFPCRVSSIKVLMMDQLINIKHAAYASDCEYKLCSTAILLFFP